MTVLINGDSWTGGWENPEQLKFRFWADHLVDSTGLAISNQALQGSSADRIARTTLLELQTRRDIDTVIIGWSSTDRGEVVWRDQGYLRITSQLVLGGAGLTDQDRQAIQTRYYTDHYDPVDSQCRFLSAVLSIQTICSAQSIRLINFQSFNDNFRKVEQSPTNLTLLSSIDWSTWIAGTMQAILRLEGYKDQGYHIEDSGMRRWAEIIKNRLDLGVQEEVERRKSYGSRWANNWGLQQQERWQKILDPAQSVKY